MTLVLADDVQNSISERSLIYQIIGRVYSDP